jgi:hypothetical protein
MFPNAEVGFSEGAKENVPPVPNAGCDGPNVGCPLPLAPKGEVIEVAGLGAFPTASDADGVEEEFVEPCPLPDAPNVDGEPNIVCPLPKDGADAKPNTALPPPPRPDGAELVPNVGVVAKAPALFSELLPPTLKDNLGVEDEAGAAAWAADVSAFPFAASIVLVPGFAGDAEEVVCLLKSKIDAAGLVPNELCVPVPNMALPVPNPVPSTGGFDDASDVAVLGVEALPNPENPPPPEVVGLKPKGKLPTDVVLSFLASLDACEALLAGNESPLTPNVNFWVEVSPVVVNGPAGGGAGNDLKENVGAGKDAGLGASVAAAGVRDDVGTAKPDVGTEALFGNLKSNFSGAGVLADGTG